MAEQPIKDDAKGNEERDIIKPSTAAEAEDGTAGNPRFGRKILCKIFRRAGEEYIEVARKKISITRDTFKHKGQEYNLDMRAIHWEKVGFGKSMTLSYQLGKPSPINFHPPDYYLDGKLAGEIHRRKAFTSLLNKMDTVLLVGMIAAIIGMVAMAGLTIYNTTEKNKVERTNAALEKENEVLKQQLGVSIVPAPTTGAK